VTGDNNLLTGDFEGHGVGRRIFYALNYRGNVISIDESYLQSHAPAHISIQDSGVLPDIYAQLLCYGGTRDSVASHTWTPVTHAYAPLPLRRAVWTVLCCARRLESTGVLPALPIAMWIFILEHLSGTDYTSADTKRDNDKSESGDKGRGAALRPVIISAYI
jgi:hypothetical protein